MRNLNRNMRGFYYSLLTSTETIIDQYGYDTGEPVSVYSYPVYAKGNISPARGEARQEQFGIDLAYDKVIQLQGTDWPIDEKTVLWVDSVPSVLENEPDGGTLANGGDSADGNTDSYDGSLTFDGTADGDYAVVRVAVSLNQTALAVKRVRNA